MVNYGFGVNVMYQGGVKTVSQQLGVTGYAMLGYLNVNKNEATVSIVASLKEVIAGNVSEFGPWGADFCVITSYKDVSKIEYYDFAKDNYEDEPLFTEIPTDWLLTVMKDWLIFLNQNPKETY